jgi:hypothetical protein
MQSQRRSTPLIQTGTAVMTTFSGVGTVSRSQRQVEDSDSVT